MKTFDDILNLFREYSATELEKGHKFEMLIQRWFLSDPRYSNTVKRVWLWQDFPAKAEFGAHDLGIDLVAETDQGEFWAIQCKCYREDAVIDMPKVDAFISQATRTFTHPETKEQTTFTSMIWVSTTSNWNPHAEQKIQNQLIPFTRINQFELRNAAVDWEKLNSGQQGKDVVLPGKSPRPHQIKAMQCAHNHFKEHDRGKLIMACGTGKTYTSLKIVEQETNKKGLVLFLVPSIALLGQGLNNWMTDTTAVIKPVCICSDSKASKLNEDINVSIVDTPYPATTNIPTTVKHLLQYRESDALVVVFSTYQSIDVVAEAQRQVLEETDGAFGVFDMIVCDEAHRTTGAKSKYKEESSFTKIHDNNFIQGRKRMYMTATPRYYNANIKETAKEKDMLLWSMDNEEFFGKEFYRIGFGEAVNLGLLTDYKVLVLTLSEEDLSEDMKAKVKGNDELTFDDASKLIGCVNALSKRIKGDKGITAKEDPGKMKRAVVFCSTINRSKRSSGIASTDFAQQFPELVSYYKQNDVAESERSQVVNVQTRHIDGGMSAEIRAEAIDWLKDEGIPQGECRILSNVRCLSEGVDVPALDAVIFASARDSQVDVVQSVGRVMRSFKDPTTNEPKKYGYIIIPVVVPPNTEPNLILDNNDRFKVVWDILNALRAHDEQFNATVNKISLNKERPSKIVVAGVPRGSFQMLGGDAQPTHYDNEDDLAQLSNEDVATQLALRFGELQDGIYAKMVEKVGDRLYWENWAAKVGDIAKKFIYRIGQLVQAGVHKEEFETFLHVLQQNLNPSITAEQTIEMLAQHMIIRPVFEALFQEYHFATNNTVSQSMQRILDMLESEEVDKETSTLEDFYQNVRQYVGKIDNLEGKQAIIKTLYEKFFKGAFPKTVDKLGIVYTPIECVDFIVHSVNDILKKEFSCSLTDENVHILDPFTGTGTFITRLLQSELILPEDMERKYLHEIHCNEIVLLAYYIADVNIESVFHELTRRTEYLSYDNICLTDTFQTTEQREPVFDKSWFEGNSANVEQQLKAPIRVIMGNPPYSIGQKSANDNAQNQSYEMLDKRITDTYVKASTAGLNKSTYDLYIKAFRWATDRLSMNKEEGGVVAFISNGAWIDGNANDGFRKCLEREFAAIYVLNLRGNARTTGELRRKEKDNVFGQGSRTPIAITLLVKKPQQAADNRATIYYHDIGDYLSREQKLKMVRDFKSISSSKLNWTILHPNAHGDWINPRNEGFAELIPLAPKKKFDTKTQSGFVMYAIGLASNRDNWVYGFSKEAIGQNMRRMIGVYNAQCENYQKALTTNPNLAVEDFIDTNPQRISWTVNLKKYLEKGFLLSEQTDYRNSLYRPFCKQYLYFDDRFIERPGLSRKLFPTPASKNLVICISCMGSSKALSVLITDKIPDLHYIGDTQCFPLYWYEESTQQGLFATAGGDYVRHDGISDWMLKEVRNRVGNRKITKEMIFYYVYGLLHSPDYRETFASDLKKSLPRIPIITDETEWMNFYHAGKMLAALHLEYENVEPCEVTINDTYTGEDEYEHYAVSKMRFPKKGEQGTIIYNQYLRVEDIPARVYEYVVNGKSAVEWIMERYAVTIDKKSLITNDPNLWSREHGAPRYIFDLLLSVMNLSVQPVDIVARLPRLHFDGSNVTITEEGHDLTPVEEEDPNTYKGSDTLKLSIKQVFFNEIVAGTKKTEFREIFNAYTANKYLATDVNGTPLCDPKHTVEGRIYHPDEYNDGHFPFVARPYKRIRFSVGSFGDSCMAEITHVTFSVSKQKGNGLVVWQAEFHLGKVTKVRRRHQ